MKKIRKQIIATVIVVFMGTVSFAQVTILDTQTKVDNFSETTVTGNFAIIGSTITNITNLDGLTSITGDLTIRDNPNLTSLEGLDGLTGAVIDLTIENNDKLTNLRGLDNLTSATVSATINSNPILTSLEGLEEFTSIGDLGLFIYNNLVLSTLNGLNNLTAVGGKLLIGTIDGTNSDPNPALTNFCAINQLVSGVSPAVTTDRYFIVNNAYNPTHAQLGIATTCLDPTLTANLTLTTQTQIDNLTPHTEIDGNVTINEATVGTITSLSGLTNITSITGTLAILENTALTSVEGLGNLVALEGQLQIGTTDGTAMNPNAALIDFCAISQLVTGTPQITTTEYFVANNGYNPSYVGLASTDAATTASETDGCRKFGTAVVSTNTFSKEDGYRLFPNPVSDVLFVKSESKNTSITISNVSGQEVLKSNSASINVRNLSKGVYFARIVSGEKTIVEKFVKL